VQPHTPPRAAGRRAAPCTAVRERASGLPAEVERGRAAASSSDGPAAMEVDGISASAPASIGKSPGHIAPGSLSFIAQLYCRRLIAPLQTDRTGGNRRPRLILMAFSPSVGAGKRLPSVYSSST
jgi:hypothetical protein